MSERERAHALTLLAWSRSLVTHRLGYEAWLAATVAGRTPPSKSARQVPHFVRTDQGGTA